MIQISYEFLIAFAGFVFVALLMGGFIALHSVFEQLHELKSELEVLKNFVKSNHDEYRKRLGLPPSSIYF